MINIKMQPATTPDLSPNIMVVGVGGGGTNAVNNMEQADMEGCNFLICNSDSQSLANSLCANKVQLGVNVTGGLGAGANPEVGRAAAEESIEEVMQYVGDANMVFITAGMGGGTGTGAAPVIAKACRERGMLTVGVVTKPFHFEGARRMKSAEAGIEEMQKYVDTLIVIPNQNLFRVANEKTTFAEGFKMADSVLQSGVRGVTDLMVRPGLVNLDFADIRTAMMEMGKAMMGTGEATGEKRAIEAAESAINNPLLDDISMKGARGVIINVTGGYDMTLFEADEACNRIRDEVDPDANIIFGATFDDSMDGAMRVSIVATGIEAAAVRKTSGGSGTGGLSVGAAGGLRRAVPNTTSGNGAVPGIPSSIPPAPSSSAYTSTVPTSSTPSAPSSSTSYAPATAPTAPVSSYVQPSKVPQASTPVATKPPVLSSPAAPVSPMSSGSTTPPPPRVTSLPPVSSAQPSVPSAMPEQAAVAPSTLTPTATSVAKVDDNLDMFEPDEFSAVQTGTDTPVPQNTALDNVGMRGTRYKNAFIPPKPAMIAQSEVASTSAAPSGFHAPGSAPSVSQEKKSASGSGLVLNPPKLPSASDRKPAPSLFERITGSVQEKLEGMKQEYAPKQSEPRVAPSADMAVPQTAFQPRLDIDKPAKDTDLDIPAFLRRQAN